MSFFQTLLSETATERQYLLDTPQIRDGVQGKISRATYVAYLGEAYHHVKHTVPLLKTVAAGLSPAQQWMRPAVEEYIAEESGHEMWILDDIQNAGGNAAAVRSGEPMPATKAMVDYAYEFVKNVNPVGFFGMVLVLEGTSTQLATQGASAIKAALKLDDDCFHYLTSHGSLDLEI